MSRASSNTRDEVLNQIALEIAGLPADPFVRVAVDGFDGAGKTTFADELGEILTARGRDVIRATIDKFHNPKTIRYALGRNSPEGFYRDSFNLSVLIANLIEPLGPRGSGHYRTGVFDVRNDLPKLEPLQQTVPKSILLFDGIFLHRPELIKWWTWSVWLEVNPALSLARWRMRDGMGSSNPAAEENSRYINGQQIYLAEADPKRRAARAVDNNDLLAPRIIS